MDFAELAATPVGVVPVRALAAFQTYLEFGLHVTPEDVYWNAADSGWAYGLLPKTESEKRRGTRCASNVEPN